MALVEPGMLCSICRKPIANPAADTFCTTANAKLYFHQQFHLLNDVGVHQSCIDSWTLRDAFITFYNSEIRDELIVDRHGHVRYRESWLSEVWRWLTKR